MDFETTYRIYPNVVLGDNYLIDDYVILGVLPKKMPLGEFETRIGADAVIRSHTVIYAGNQIGDHFQTGHGVLIRELNQIGDDVSVGSHSMIEHHVIIGNRVRIHSGVFIPEYSKLDDECWIGPCVVFTNARYPRSRTVKECLIGAHIMQNAKIGAGAIILPGVKIGRSALIGAGAVIVHDVPDGAVVVGNPARIIKSIQDIPDYQG